VTSIASKRRNPFDASRCGDEMMRTTLYEAVLLRSAKWSWLKAWAMKIVCFDTMRSQPSLQVCILIARNNN
jgi:hypothetical protein